MGKSPPLRRVPMPNHLDAAIDIRNLKKHYGRYCAVNDVSLSVAHGEEGRDLRTIRVRQVHPDPLYQRP